MAAAPLITCPKLTLQGTNDQMPQFGLGTWLSEPGKVYEATKHALKSGYRLLDCAWIYFNEGEVGKGLKECIDEGIVKREDVWVTGKLWNNFHRPELVKKGLQESLDALGVSYLDLYLIHFPVSFKPDITEATTAEQVEQIPLADTWAAMEALVDEGLVKNIGISNFEIPQVQEILACSKKAVAVNQFESQPYYQRRELVEFCKSKGIVVTAHTSLGSPGNVMSSHHASKPLMDNETVKRLATKYAKSASHVLLRWGIQRGTAVIPKSITPSRLESNAEIFDFELSAEEMASLDALDKPGLEGCFNHPKTPWLGRSEFTGNTAHYCNA
eukprot:TRINITY_DN33515_c0_g1_i1.p1 TRINITY_DN33515_c0_g1~~TRINITY_DN33515_c0_g1_i1.p1  ORF type:complete len:328 (+),score=68.82 TRINITY_DN33515_c0_g1_i1:60-1043(+)